MPAVLLRVLYAYVTDSLLVFTANMAGIEASVAKPTAIRRLPLAHTGHTLATGVATLLDTHFLLASTSARYLTASLRTFELLR